MSSSSRTVFVWGLRLGVPFFLADFFLFFFFLSRPLVRWLWEGCAVCGGGGCSIDHVERKVGSLEVNAILGLIISFSLVDTPNPGFLVCATSTCTTCSFFNHNLLSRVQYSNLPVSC